MTYSVAFAVLWAAWVASWLIASRWASPPANRPPAAEERRYWALNLAGAALLFLNFRRVGGLPLTLTWSVPDAAEWTLFAIAVAGLAFTWWARIHLGALWSGRVTRKADHRIVDTGPYAIVRHPIYTGILAALYATALLRPGPFGLAGVAVMTLSFVVKYRLEERFLTQELGAEAYAGYRARVPALVPFWPMPRG